jgi:hypothetical protein
MLQAERQPAVCGEPQEPFHGSITFEGRRDCHVLFLMGGSISGADAKNFIISIVLKTGMPSGGLLRNARGVYRNGAIPARRPLLERGETQI